MPAAIASATSRRGGRHGHGRRPLPLYAGAPDERQARRLVDEHLLEPTRFGPSPESPWSVTTVAKSSAAYAPRNYWRGPVWINVNWFLVRGLERCGLEAEAAALRDSTLELVTRSGFTEYYEPSTGAPLGSRVFSWSASSRWTCCVTYDPEPRYPVSGGEVELGHEPLAAEVGVARRAGRRRSTALRRSRGSACSAALPRARCRALDVRRSFRPWDEVKRRTAAPTCRATRSSRGLRTARRATSSTRSAASGRDAVTLVFGPGAALVPHDELWYADVPEAARARGGAARRGAERRAARPASAERSSGCSSSTGPCSTATSRSFSRASTATSTSATPTPPLASTATRSAARSPTLARRPFRTLPTFLPGPWGGHWLRDELGDRDGRAEPRLVVRADRARGGILVGRPRGRLRAAHGGRRASAILGAEVAARSAARSRSASTTSTRSSGGHLSIQCHPSRGVHARDVRPAVHTGRDLLRDADDAGRVGVPRPARRRRPRRVRARRRAAPTGRAFDAERFLQAQAAEQHQLYLIPAGTPHASGAGNVVLEISATPYLYTLRFYDWLRRDLEGTLRPVHLDHAFANLDPRRRGDAVAAS